MEALQAEIVECRQLGHSVEQAICDLYLQYYASNRQLVLADLKEKDRVLLLRDSDGRIQGFSTILLMTSFEAGVESRIIFSGDTIIHQAYWGTQALSLSWCRFAGEQKSQHPDVPLYWLLIVKGYRTYRYLPLFSKTFYPNCRYDTPAHIQALVDSLAERRFGVAYQPDRGVVAFAESRGHLRADWSDIPPRLASNRDVAYFLSRNPGYTRGEELVCFTELSEENLRSYALRAFREALV